MAACHHSEVAERLSPTLAGDRQHHYRPKASETVLLRLRHYDRTDSLTSETKTTADDPGRLRQ
jgi:hypothetical protein